MAAAPRFAFAARVAAAAFGAFASACAGGVGTHPPTDASVPMASCHDGEHNGNETDVDCGGSCDPCATGQGCQLGSDCASGVCTSGICQAPTCSDGTRNGQETDVDCGGGTCPQCVLGKACMLNSDCTTGACMTMRCCSIDNQVLSTGLQSGIAGPICCPSGYTLTQVVDCGTGQNHSAYAVDPNCGKGVEGANNGGSACAEIHCQLVTCQ
jgi:hypothetical protein